MNKEQKILSLIETGVETITTANGYASDIGSNRKEWTDGIYPESETEVIEVRDISGDPTDEYEPLQKEILTYEFAVGCKKGNSTADYLRKVRNDIYKMIGANYKNWRSEIGGGLVIRRGSWEKDIQRGKDIFGEMSVTITVEYFFEEWFVGDTTY